MNFFRHRLMNEADESGDGAEGGWGDDGESESGPLDFMGDSDEQVFKNFGLDPNKYKEDKSEVNEETDNSQGSEEDQKAAQAIEEKSYLDRVNALGAIHNEAPVKVESEEQLKELIQKGFDYTQKTQGLSEERKSWESEKVKTETELNAAINSFNESFKAHEKQLQELQQWQFALKELEQEAPDVLEEVQRRYQQTVKQFSNPVLEKHLAEQNRRFEELEKKLTSREDKLIVDSFESDFQKVASFEQSLKELGINVSKDEVKKQWAATGLPVEQVIGAIYGSQMLKAQASKAKVETTKQKVAAKPIGGAGASRPGTKAHGVDPKLRGLSYASALWDKYST